MLSQKSDHTYVVFNKPFEVLCQFSGGEGKTTLKKYIPIPDIYSVGRLDFDSEGLLLLTNDNSLNHKLAEPSFKQSKTYLVQVEGIPTPGKIQRLEKGVDLKDGITLPAKVRHLAEEPIIWPRSKPIRYRKSIPTSWLEITIVEGKNRQVRRMTAAVGLPCLRLIRTSIGPIKLGELKPGEYKTIEKPTL